MLNTTRRGFLGWLGAALVLRKATLPAAPPLPPPSQAMQRFAAIVIRQDELHSSMARAWRNAQRQILAHHRPQAPEWFRYQTREEQSRMRVG